MEPKKDEPTHYQIRVYGQFGDKWSNWFSGLTVTHHAEETILTGPVVDQAALRGLLNRIWDLNLTLISVASSPDPWESTGKTAFARPENEADDTHELAQFRGEIDV